MITKEELQNKSDFDITYSFGRITKKGRFLTISWQGNMGNSINNSVDPMLKMYDFPEIHILKQWYDVIEEYGNPDYSWHIKLKL